MRRRALRDLGTLAGVAVILAIVVTANVYMRFQNLSEAAIELREKLEKKHEEEGTALLKWDVLKKTKGTSKSGPTFTPDLASQDKALVHIVGFMTPVDQFRRVDRFMLLPMPLYCYFCQAPPMRHVIFVQMRPGKPVEKIYNEPVLIHGRFSLHPTKGEPFFYSIDLAGWGKAQDGEYSEKEISAEHLEHYKLQSKEVMEQLEASKEMLPPDPNLAPPSSDQ